MDDTAMRHLVCTVITPNYLGQFLSLGESLARELPGADVRVLVLQDCADVSAVQARIDEYLAEAPGGSRHLALSVDDVDWGDFDVAAASVFYSVLEFATSVKPALLRSLLREGWERVTYLDPDTRVFADFTPLLDDAAALSLTPHFLSDIPRDGHRPTTYDVLMAGVFNLGFASARPMSMPFLDWWSRRLQFECLNDHRRGHFTDQKILDLAHLRTRVQVVDHPGVNVAYWNLHERRVVEADAGWAVEADGGSHPLYLFHFSGFSPAKGADLSIHSSRRHVGEAVPRHFVRDYERRLASAGSPHPFTLGGAELADPVPEEWHRALRQDAEAHVRAGTPLEGVRDDVYAPVDPSAWEPCLSCSERHGGFGARALSFLAGWACHPSLIGVPNGVEAMFRGDDYSHRAGAHAQLSWAATGLRPALRGAPEVATAVLRAGSAAARDAADLALVGYLSCPTGIGQIARWALASAESAGLRVAVERVYALGDSPEYLAALLARRNPVAAADASALCFVNADQWFAHVVGPGRVNPRTQHVEAVWAWELEHVPASMFEAAATGGPARVHALSSWSAHALGRVLPVPVQRFAPFDLELVDALEAWSGRRPGAVDGPYVMTTFDAKSYLARKNPEGVLEVWRRIADDFPDHRLVIKSADLRELAPPDLLDAIDASPRTTLVDHYLSDAEYTDLLAHASAFVSLHRSEGMGLTPIEAGLCGLPVVYTDYGGVADFLQGGFYPVAYSTARVGDAPHAAGPYDEDAEWAEPDLDDAERQLRRALSVDPGDHDVALLVDRKQLVENLRLAQAEVVATAERLIETARRREEDASALVDELERAASSTPEVEPLPSPNRLAFALVAAGWGLYKLLPRSVRRQVNIALAKLRREHDRD